MPKIITSRRREGTQDKAIEYIKSHILFPSGLLGMIFMVSGMASLAYQFMALSYDSETFVETVGLLTMGALLGWGQTRYHQHVLREDPIYFAERMRVYSRTAPKRSRKEPSLPTGEHGVQRFIPLYYMLGIVLLLGVSAWASMFGRTYYVAAFLMPWAGFFWAKMFFWRGLLREVKSKK
ncbi:MAG TPA: hypothetical protein VJ692_10145 [Nitrospiraceae bacterium]|nr:hypothetical protein [Nitrospiraceae bacterium]